MGYSTDKRFMATTADILGLNSGPAIPRRWAGHYKRLCSERDRLSARDCSAPESSATKLDELADAGAEETLQDMSLVSAAATNETLSEVLEALQRIERGTYGICEISGQPIEAERLNAIPWARYSYAGQNELEKGGFGRKPGLPALELVREPEPAEEED
jgi:RNA polymerase-binding transcription factor DksA